MIIQENIRATIYFRNGAYRQILEKDIIRASIQRQCCPDSNFEIGGVYSASLSMTANVSGTNSYNIRGAKIVIENKYANEQDFQYMGVFWVTQAQRISGDLYALTAQDAVGWLDTSSFMSENGTENLTQMLTDYSDSPTTLENPNNGYWQHGGWCVRLMEYVNDILEGIVGERILHWDLYDFKTNGQYTNNSNFSERKLDFVCSVQNASGLTDSPRDILHYLAELAGGFIYAKENGSLTLGQFGQAEFGEPEIFLHEIEVDSCEIAEYQLQLVLVKISGCPPSWTTITDFATLVPIRIVITHNPFAEGFEALAIDTLETLKEGLYYFHHRKDTNGNLIYENFSHFRPFHCKVHKPERFHLGQRIKLTLDENNPIQSTITSVKWTFRGGWELACAGADSRTMADALSHSKADKALIDSKLRCENLLAKISGGGV